jgi:hypothetical protein
MADMTAQKFGFDIDTSSDKDPKATLYVNRPPNASLRRERVGEVGRV